MPISKRTIKRIVKAKYTEIWQECWDHQDTGRYTYEIFPKISLKRFKTDHHYVQASTNHGKFPVYYKRFLNKKLNCPCGANSVQADAKHYIFSYPLMDNIRQAHFPRDYATRSIAFLFTDYYCAKGIINIIKKVNANLITQDEANM
ncbi:hypothetical protein X975_01047, partial [Stegodyphus mimosarum]